MTHSVETQDAILPLTIEEITAQVQCPSVDASSYLELMERIAATDWDELYDAQEESSDERCTIGDFCEAVHFHLIECHQGQGHVTYEAQSAIGLLYNPGFKTNIEVDETAWFLRVALDEAEACEL